MLIRYCGILRERTDPDMKQRKRATARAAAAAPTPPKALGAELRAKRNPVLDRQTRKVLGRHYAARYRVR